MIQMSRGEGPGKKNEPVYIYEIEKMVKSICDHDAAGHKETALPSYAEKDMLCSRMLKKNKQFSPYPLLSGS